MQTNSDSASTLKGLLSALAVMAIVLLALFSKAFQDDQALFANDGPLGQNMAAYGQLPDAFTGMWNDLYWVGGWQGTAVPDITFFLFWLLKPIGFAKFSVPVSLLILGLSSWFFFRQLGFYPFVCLAGALAAMLNMNSFSNGCWGLPTWVLAKSMVFVAMGLLLMRHRAEWLRIPLAGMAVGICVMEGFDTGAIYSIYVAIFAMFLFLENPRTASGRAWITGAIKVAVVAAFAAFIAAQTLSTLVGTQISGVSGMAQDKQTREQRWSIATQWSLPKIETLRVIIPGLYGYRMDTAEGGQYWGTVGQNPGIEDLIKATQSQDDRVRTQAQQTVQNNPSIFRYSGSGEYAGVLVVLLAVWALLQSFRGGQSSFSAADRRWVWFWTGIAFVSLLLAFGKYAPFYKLLYQLPYFSTIRNPIKFLQPFHLAVGILFAYGLQDLWRRYLDKPIANGGSIGVAVKGWWSTVSGFDRSWTRGTLMVVGAAILGWLMYGSSKRELLRHLESTGFGKPEAQLIASFSMAEVGLFVLFLILSVIAVAFILSGVLSGERARFAGLMVGALLVVDMARANLPWIIFYNYKEKYASNDIIEILRNRPYDHRVAIMPYSGFEHLSILQNFYQTQWLQHHFPYYNIQSMNIAQEPRTRKENEAYRDALRNIPMRLWQLSNTRYLLGLKAFSTPQGVVDFVEVFNQQLDPVKKRFRAHTPFILEQTHPDAPVNLKTNAGGPFALIEFTGALPRAKLYSQWRTLPDEQALKELTNTQWDPEQTVLVAESPSVPTPPANAVIATNDSVQITEYAPKRLQLKGRASVPSVLLLNDKHDPSWKVTVNGQPADLLRCNYLMRGVYLQPGEFTVEFHFDLPSTTRYVSWAAVFCGVLMIGMLFFVGAAPTGTSEPAKPEAKKDTEPPAASGKKKSGSAK